MLIKSIKLQNIRSYREEEVTFPKGTLLLSGDIGAGKSSILHAIEFGLFGIKKGSLPAQSLLRKGKNDGSVELSIIVGGNEVLIGRNLKRHSKGIRQEAGYIEIDGKRHDYTPVEMRSKIYDLIGYPKSLIGRGEDLVYRFTVYTPQEEMKHILFSDPQMRLDTLRRVFRIDKYKRLKENAAEYVKTLKDRTRLEKGRTIGLSEKEEMMKQRRLLLGRTKDDLERCETELKKVMKDHSEKKKGILESEERLDVFRTIKQQTEILKTKLEEKLRQRVELERRMKQYAEEILTLEKRSASIESTSDEPDIGSAEKDLEILQDEYRESSEKRAAFTERLQNLKRSIKELSMQAEEFSEDLKKETEYIKKVDLIKKNLEKKDTFLGKLKEKEEAMKALDSAITKAEVYKLDADELVNRISDLKECPTCLQTVDGVHKRSILEKENNVILENNTIISKLAVKRVSLKEEIESMHNKLDTLSEQEIGLARIKSWFDEFYRRKATMLQSNEEIDRLKEEVLLTEKELDTLSDMKMLDSIEKKKKAITMIRELHMRFQERKHILLRLDEKRQSLRDAKNDPTFAEENINEIKKERDLSITKSDAFGDIEKEHLEKKVGFQNLSGLLEEIKLRRERLKSEHDSLEAFCIEIEEDVRKMREAYSRLKTYEGLSIWLQDQFMNLMSTIEKHVMVKINREFKSLFQNWFDMLVEDDTTSVSIDDEFTPLVFQNGHDIDVAHLSGGEKTSIALAYRLALNKVINDLIKTIRTDEIIILDEPTDGFSSDQLDRVRDVLEEIGAQQTIIVSHDPKIESFVENIVRIEKTEHVSRVL